MTGVSQGIGLAVADALIAEGMKVLGTSRTAPPPRAGLEHLAVDMTSLSAGDQAVAAVVQRFGRLDVLVNNVGGAKIGTGFTSHPDEEWSKYFELNLMTTVRTTRCALPHLAAVGGVVINISSLNGHLPSTGIYPYNATKAAMDSLTTGLSSEYAPKGVRVVGVAPGPVNTPLWLGQTGVAAQASVLESRDAQTIVDEAIANIPVGRFTTPEEVAYLVAFLASARAATITGTTVNIDGGLTPST